ncbi:hypothetical protein Drorol1_Dr00019127 [Drosera rotundifolia]
MQVYIVYMGSLTPQNSYSASSNHVRMLQEILNQSSVEDSLIRSCTRSFNAFAANLTERQSQRLSTMEGVVSVFPSRTLQLHTTRSWDFMGFPQTVYRNPAFESDVIIGVIDGGIWPESKSFHDEGISPVPKKWKGACHGGKDFTCNRKIIGARNYVSGDSVRDEDGHGTHTASTAAGRVVKNANFYGLGRGIARGAVPSARIAAYKVCGGGCPGFTILAAFDDAIADGVDIITISMGPDYAIEMYDDSIAIGSFHAMAKGILTAQSAGNYGPHPRSVISVAPWLLSVAASNTDRRYFNKVFLGEGTELRAYSIDSWAWNRKKVPLLYGKDVTSNCDEDQARVCEAGCLDHHLVKGKIVICDGSLREDEAMCAVKASGAWGAIFETSSRDVSDSIPSSVALLPFEDLEIIKAYKNFSLSPRASISRSQANHVDAPIVVDFSSRGPNDIATEILKPDITAPGVEILAAYSPNASVVEGCGLDKRSVNYSILSGTSMSCPHAAGVAAYIKSLHPDWSPSAIKSALMTTARPMDAIKNMDAEFAYGSGHIDPLRAIDPGLVYESSEADFISFLCNMGYDTKKIKLISGHKYTCPKKRGDISSTRHLNYPSMAGSVLPQKPFRVEFQRTVTNLGPVISPVYSANIYESSRINVKVLPETISFNEFRETKTFVVTVTGEGLKAGEFVSASLVWSDGVRFVRSPIILYAKDESEKIVTKKV